MGREKGGRYGQEVRRTKADFMESRSNSDAATQTLVCPDNQISIGHRAERPVH